MARISKGISASLALLLAACGGGGGGNLTTSSQPEPEPPVIGPLVPSSEIIDIIIEQPEEEEEENQETQTQQIIIIEEEDIPYVPPEEKEYERSPQTQTTNGLNIGEEVIVDRVTTILEGSFPAGPTGGADFPYGLWASEGAIHNNTNFIDNRIAFLELTEFLNPTTRPGHYTSHENTNGDIRYEREDGFKGVYIYEGEAGELTGDVELRLGFESGYIQVDGNISSDLEIEGNNLGGIIITFGEIDLTTGVGSYTPEGITTIAFGRVDLSDDTGDLTTMHDLGQAKLRMVLSPDGRHARASGKTSQPESYPSYIAGEVEINGFKINSGDGDHNTVVGVFIGDKQEQ